MAKIAIVTDSNSGITQEEAEKLNIFILPMPFTINGTVYLEGINLTTDQFFKEQIAGSDIFTSQPAVGDISKLWDNILKDYDQIIHIPMSSGLSGSCQTATMLAKEYQGKVTVIDDQRISVTQKRDVILAKELVDQGHSAEEIASILLKYKFDSAIYIYVPTLDYLKKGGRITQAAALLGGMLKIKPVLQIKGEKLDAFAKPRTLAKAIKIMKEAIEKDAKALNSDFYIDVAYSYNKQPAIELVAELKEQYPQHEIFCDPLSLSVSCHVGPDTLAIAVSKKVN